MVLWRTLKTNWKLGFRKKGILPSSYILSFENIYKIAMPDAPSYINQFLQEWGLGSGQRAECVENVMRNAEYRFQNLVFWKAVGFCWVALRVEDAEDQKRFDGCGRLLATANSSVECYVKENLLSELQKAIEIRAAKRSHGTFKPVLRGVLRVVFGLSTVMVLGLVGIAIYIRLLESNRENGGIGFAALGTGVALAVSLSNLFLRYGSERKNDKMVEGAGNLLFAAICGLISILALYGVSEDENTRFLFTIHVFSGIAGLSFLLIGVSRVVLGPISRGLDGGFDDILLGIRNFRKSPSTEPVEALEENKQVETKSN